MKKYFAVLLAICSLTASAHRPIDTALGNVTADNARLTVNHPSADSIGAPALTDKESVISRHYRNYKLRPFTAPLMLAFTIGVATNLGGTGDVDWVGPKNRARGLLNMRLSYYPLRHVGIFGETGISLNHPSDKWNELLGADLVHPEDEEFTCLPPFPILFFTTEAAIGLTYQTTFGPWQVQAYGGYGGYWPSLTAEDDLKVLYLENTIPNTAPPADPTPPDEEVTKTKILEVSRDIHVRYLTFGITLGFGKSRGFKWIVDLSYRTPLNTCTTTVTYYDNLGQNPNIVKHSAKVWGHELVVTFGFQGICDTRKKTPRHRRQASELFY